MTEMAKAIYEILPMQSMEISAKGGEYGVNEVLTLLSKNPTELKATIGDVSDQINRTKAHLDGIQAYQREHAARDVPPDVVFSSKFHRIIWPYIAILLAGLKIARVAYVVKFLEFVRGPSNLESQILTRMRKPDHHS
jgi:hypothetical protein